MMIMNIKMSMMITMTKIPGLPASVPPEQLVPWCLPAAVAPLCSPPIHDDDDHDHDNYGDDLYDHDDHPHCHGKVEDDDMDLDDVCQHLFVHHLTMIVIMIMTVNMIVIMMTMIIKILVIWRVSMVITITIMTKKRPCQ